MCRDIPFNVLQWVVQPVLGTWTQILNELGQFFLASQWSLDKLFTVHRVNNVFVLLGRGPSTTDYSYISITDSFTWSLYLDWESLRVCLQTSPWDPYSPSLARKMQSEHSVSFVKARGFSWIEFGASWFRNVICLKVWLPIAVRKFWSTKLLFKS